jgi:sulfate/thiosulfate transport system permease protein
LSARETIPGRPLLLGTTLMLVAAVVVVPLAALVFSLHGVTAATFAGAVLAPRALAAFRLTFGSALAASGVDLLAGLFVAWILVRYRFPGRAGLDALVDIPFALPPSVTGITLAMLYSVHGAFGGWLEAHGLHVAYTQLGIGVALTFVAFPFVVRTVQEPLAKLPAAFNEAAASLGASEWTIFVRVTLPLLAPALLTAFTLALARTLGEYGSVIFIAGNIPNRTEIAPLLIVTRLEEYDYAGAAAIAVVLLAVSFAMLLAINGFQRRMTLARTAL